MQRSSDRNIYLYLGVLAVSLAVVRLIFASALPLASDEAYYFQWSRDLKLSYFDHPPLTAWLIRAGTILIGETTTGVRLFSVLLVSLSVFVVHRIGLAAGLSPNYAVLASALATILPAPSTGAILVTPDTPLAVCFLFSVLALVRLVSKTSPFHWYLLMSSFGFGLLSKHSALLVIPLLAVALIISKRMRTDLRTVHPWLALVLFVIIILPYLVAEITAGIPSITFQSSHLSGGLDQNSTVFVPLLILRRFLELIGGQIGLLTPLVAWWVLVGLKKKEKTPVFKILLAGLLIPVIAAFLSGFFTHPEQNWASLGHPLAAIVSVAAISGSFKTGSRSPQKKRFWWMFAILLSAFVVTIVIHTQALISFLPLPPEKDPVSRLHGWDGLVELSETARYVDAVVCDNYGLAAQFSWVFRSEKIEAIGLDRPHSLKPGTWLLLDEKNDWGRAQIHVNCETMKPLETLSLRRADGAQLREIDVYLGEKCIL